MVLHLNKLESPSPKDALCQVWLKLAQWFWRRRWKSLQTNDRQSEKITWMFSSGKLKSNKNCFVLNKKTSLMSRFTIVKTVWSGNLLKWNINTCAILKNAFIKNILQCHISIPNQYSPFKTWNIHKHSIPVFNQFQSNMEIWITKNCKQWKISSTKNFTINKMQLTQEFWLHKKGTVYIFESLKLK